MNKLPEWLDGLGTEMNWDFIIGYSIATIVSTLVTMQIMYLSCP